jgi:hypothetical protein
MNRSLKGQHCKTQKKYSEKQKPHACAAPGNILNSFLQRGSVLGGLETTSSSTNNVTMPHFLAWSIA